MDIVFFHGLQLSAGENAYYSTWVNGSGVCWPIEWLQQDFPGARIMSVKYDAQAIGHPGQQGLRDLAQSILTDLHHANVGKQHNTLRDVPLVLVGHSLGGVVLKQVCVAAQHTSTQMHCSFCFTAMCTTLRRRALAWQGPSQIFEAQHLATLK